MASQFNENDINRQRDGKFGHKHRAEAEGIVLAAPIDVYEPGDEVVPASDLRVGDWVRLDAGDDNLVQVTSLDNDHKTTSVEFDDDEETIADYDNEEMFVRASLLAVHNAGRTGYYSVDDADLGEAAAVYEKTLLWSSTVIDENEEQVPADSLDAELSPEAQEQIRAEVQDFLSSNMGLIEQAREVSGGYGLDQAMHDFALTRNGHGTGFWDRGLGDVGDRLTEAAKAHGEMNLELGDDGQIHIF